MNAICVAPTIWGSDLVASQSKGWTGPVGYRLLRHLREGGSCTDGFALALYIEEHHLMSTNVDDIKRLDASTWALNLAVTELARRLPASSL